MADVIINLFIPVAIIIIAMITGSILEKRHYKSIEERERATANMAILSTRAIPEGVIAESRLADGSVVVSIDYFKRFLASLRNIFGGEVRSYCSLLDRGRREAILRMKESCPDADLIANLRIETSNICKENSGRRKSIGAVEVYAYGTAIRFDKTAGS